MIQQELENYLFELIKGYTPIISKQDLSKIVQKAYIDGYNYALKESYNWMKDYIQYSDTYSEVDLNVFKRDFNL